MENNNKTDVGTMAGIIIVVLVLLVGGYYFANQRIEKSKEFQATINQGDVTTIPATTSSDEVSDIEKDANSVNFDSLGAEIDNL